MGASADGLFAGVTACGLALLATAAARRGGAGAGLALAAGVVLGFACFLSYGLVLVAPLAVAVLVAARRVTPLLSALAGVAAVVVAFAAAGFWWLDGYHALVERYYQGIASDRPYRYWVWANLACVVLAAGPAMAAVARRAVLASIRRAPVAVWWVMPLAALVAILAADLSGMSKAEVERIWLPFVVWLPAGAVLLPAGTRRGWLVVQAATALLVNHLLLTTW